MNNKLLKLLIIPTSLFLLFLILPKVQAQTAWKKMTSNISEDPEKGLHLKGISGESKRDVFAVGVAGIIRHYDEDGDDDGIEDKEWEIVTSPTKENLNAVWGGTKSGVYVVGNNATILFGYKGIHWSMMQVPKNDPPVRNLHGIWGSAGNNVFAVGDEGIILHYDGDGDNDGDPDNLWEIMKNPDEDKKTLFGVWGSSENNVFAVGANGIILRYDGDGDNNDKPDNIWEIVVKPGKNESNLHGVWGITGSIIVAVGAEGTTTYTMDRGNNWMPQRFGRNNFNGIWGTSPGTVFIAGSAGTVFNYINNEVFDENIPEGINLNAIWVSHNTHVFVVGDNGIIYIEDPEGYYWMEGKICSACSGDPIDQAQVCEVINPPQCTTDTFQDYLTDSQGGYEINRFSTESHTFRFSATDHQTQQRSVDLLLNCSITNNTFLFKDPDYKKCIAGVVSKVCDSYNWFIGSPTDPTKKVTVKLDKAIGCEFPETYNYRSTSADPETGLFNFLNLEDGVYKIKLEAEGCTFTAVTTNVATIPHTEAEPYNFIGTGTTGLCVCPVPSEVPFECGRQRE